MGFKAINLRLIFKALTGENKFNANFVLAGIYAIPILLLLSLVYQFSVNVPFWDDWSLLRTFYLVNDHSLTFHDLWAPHNEHRLFFPKLIFIPLAFISKWNVQVEIYFSVFLAMLNFIFIYNISKITVGKNKKFFHLFNILSCFLIFSLAQTENWLWGYQMSWFLVDTFFILAVFILSGSRRIGANKSLILAGLCCFAATFSSAHGILAWLAVIPLVYFSDGERKQKVTRLLFWITFFLLSITIYLIDYRKPAYHPDTFFFLKNPIESLKYLLVVLGYPLNGYFKMEAEQYGFVMLLNFVAFNIYAFKCKDSSFCKLALPWLSLGWFVVLFALMLMVGRSGFGINQAYTARYATVSILLIIANLQLWRLFIDKSWILLKKVRYTHIFLYLAATIFIVISLINSFHSLDRSRQTLLERKQGGACLEVIHFLSSSFDISFDDTERRQNCLYYVYHRPLILRKSVELLEELGFRTFPTNMQFIDNPPQVYGQINSPVMTDLPVALTKNSVLDMAGWAGFLDQDYLPQIILISYDDQQLFFANGLIEPINSNKKIHWKASVSIASLPLGERTIKAWIYDKENKKFIRLDGEVKITVNQ